MNRLLGERRATLLAAAGRCGERGKEIDLEFEIGVGVIHVELVQVGWRREHRVEVRP